MQLSGHLFVTSYVCGLDAVMAHTSKTLKLCWRSLVLNYRSHQCMKTNVQSVTTEHLFIRSFTSRDVVLGNTTSPPNALLQNLKSAVGVSKVLEIVERHHKEMDSKHTLEALKSIFDQHKSGRSELSKTDLINGLVFPSLCKNLKTQAREYHLNDIIEVLKIVTYMGIPTSSITVQILLQLIRKQVNDLSLQSIIFLDFMLSNLSSCPLVDALKIALPLVCESQLKMKLDTADMNHVIDVLQYASHHTLSASSIDYILQTLERFDSSAMDVNSAKKVAWSLCRLKYFDVSYNNKLLHAAQQVLSKNTDALKFQEIEYTLHLLTSKRKKKKDFLYNEDFVNNCGSYIIKQDCGFEKAIHILHHLSKLDYIHIDLLEYIAQHLVKNPKFLEGISTSMIMAFVRGLSLASYKPESWSCVKEAILNCSTIQQEKRLDLPWIKFVLDLAFLDCFSDGLLERVFQEDFLDKILAREYNFLDLLQILALNQVVFTLYPSYKGNLPTRRMLDEAAANNEGHMKDFPLQGALECGLGGASYLQTGVYTQLGHFIDHVIVMRKGGFPIAINKTPRQDPSSRIYMEELVVPADGQVVMTLCHPASCYAVNCSRLKGYYALIGKTLEALGYTVVHINLQKWTSIPDREKIPYLMQKIRLQCEAQTDEVYALQ